MKIKDYIEVPAPEIVDRFGQKHYIDNKAYKKGDLAIWVNRELHGGCLRWHLSISTPTRYPTWDEIRDARYALLPDNITMGMLLPPKRDYVNVHPNCFHLHEIVD